MYYSQERHRNQAVPEQGTEGVLREDLRLLPVRVQPVPEAEVLPVRGDVHELRAEAEVVQGRMGMADGGRLAGTGQRLHGHEAGL